MLIVEGRVSVSSACCSGGWWRGSSGLDGVLVLAAVKLARREAFAMLTHVSQRINTKLSDVAAELVRAGVLRSRCGRTINQIPSLSR
jgi:hypothetical protein